MLSFGFGWVSVWNPSQFRFKILQNLGSKSSRFSAWNFPKSRLRFSRICVWNSPAFKFEIPTIFKRDCSASRFEIDYCFYLRSSTIFFCVSPEFWFEILPNLCLKFSKICQRLKIDSNLDRFQNLNLCFRFSRVSVWVSQELDLRFSKFSFEFSFEIMQYFCWRFSRISVWLAFPYEIF